MIQHDKTNVSEGVDLNKTSSSKECVLCHCWFFKDIGFKPEKHVCNECHGLLTMTNSLKDILSANGATYRCILIGSSTNEALEKLNKSVTRDREVL